MAVIATRGKKKGSKESLPGTNSQKGAKKCSRCHSEKKLTEYYISSSPLFQSDKRVPICKKCVQELCLNEDGTINEIELNKTLRILDKPYYKDSMASARNQFASEHSYVDDESIDKYGDKLLSLYFKNIAMRQDKDKSYEDSEKDGFMHQNNNTPRTEKEKIAQRYADINGEKNKILMYQEELIKQDEIEWSMQDIQNKDYAIEIIGYDPFVGYPEWDRRFLFNQLAPYLEDDDIADDAYKLSQILQIVDNNKQIRQCDVKISNLDPIKDADNIKLLNGIKKDLVMSNDKIAKENEISVKNRSNKDVGKSTLTYLMRDLRNRDFDRAEADYYDQLKSAGTRWAADMSMTSIIQHGMFDENDKKDIYETQLRLIDKLNQELDDAKEKIRLLLLEIDKLKAGVSDGDK